MRLRFAEDTLFSHRFGAEAPFRISVEEELFVVDHATYAISARTDELLAVRRPRFAGGRVSGTLWDGVVELATPVCATADEVVDALRALREAVLAEDVALLLGAGLHPATPFGDVRRRGSDHDGALLRDARAIVAQGPFCGLRVHVGMPDPDTAIAAYNGMRKWVPLLQALGANSPFWHGRDSGLQSARTVRAHQLPRTGLPRAFRGWDDYRAAMRELVRVADIAGPGSLWWDVRPHPSLGTLEIRVLDAQSSLDDVRGLIALVHCLAYHEALTADPLDPPKEILDAATFHAIRDGLDARLPHGGTIQHLQGIARQAMDLATGYAFALGCSEALTAVDRLLGDGNGAARQRRAHDRAGMPAVVEQIVRETGAGATSPQPGPFQGAAA